MPSDAEGATVRTCAVIVAFHPAPSLHEGIARVRDQVGHLIVVDNTPGGTPILRDYPPSNDVSIVTMGANAGVGAALNRGFSLARNLGFTWVLTLDQDSMLGSEAVVRLQRALDALPGPGSVAMVGPRIVHAHDPTRPYRYLARKGSSRWRYRRVPVTEDGLLEPTVIITSGALTRTSVHQDLGGFREDFFIDYVDTEFCLRARAAGNRILAVGDATLTHRLGSKRPVRRLGYTAVPMFHDPTRVYYIHRNRIPMYRMYARAFPHWFLFDLTAAIYNLFRILFFEDRRWAKLAEATAGTLDGCRGRMGPRPEPGTR